MYVRVYEDRIDLLRAAIVGPAGTPYHDGLFFFDVRFPAEYPKCPPVCDHLTPSSPLIIFLLAQPSTVFFFFVKHTWFVQKVHYHSGGLRLNPNLYESGKVCLSLLNTWWGNGCEKWGKSNSTMLQVLVSIQGLVLNDKPYFNEPGNKNSAKTTAGEKNSLAYNQTAFVLSCKTMLYSLRKPPKVTTNHSSLSIHCVFQATRRYYYHMKLCIPNKLCVALLFTLFSSPPRSISRLWLRATSTSASAPSSTRAALTCLG